jgi:hypothetical protein
VEEKMEDAAPAAVEKMDAAPAAVVVPTEVVPTEAAPAAVEEPMEAAPAAVEEKTQPEDAGDADEDPSSDMEEEVVPDSGLRDALTAAAKDRIAALRAKGPVPPQVEEDIWNAVTMEVYEREDPEAAADMREEFDRMKAEAALRWKKFTAADKSDSEYEDLYAAAGGEMTLADFP